MKFQQDILNQAFSKCYNRALTLDEQTGARTIKALEKAMKNAETNETIEFSGQAISFYSLESSEHRMVTKNGCYTTCTCKGEISYHSELYNLVVEYLNEKQQTAHKEFLAFARTMPAWLKDEGQIFWLWMQPKDVCEKWLADHSPRIRESSTKKAETVGGIRI